MLRIRLQRVGRKNRSSYRIVVAEHSDPVKGRSIERLGYYDPLVKPKVFEVDTDELMGWIKRGAKPTNTLARLLMAHGVKGMEPYIVEMPDRKKKKAEEPSSAPATEVSEKPAAPEASVSAEATTDAPVSAEATTDAPVAKTPVPPAAEEAKAEEKPAEEAPAEEAKKAEAPADGVGVTAEPSTPEGRQAGDAVETHLGASQDEPKVEPKEEAPAEEVKEEPFSEESTEAPEKPE